MKSSRGWNIENKALWLLGVINGRGFKIKAVVYGPLPTAGAPSANWRFGKGTAGLANVSKKSVIAGNSKKSPSNHPQEISGIPEVISKPKVDFFDFFSQVLARFVKLIRKKKNFSIKFQKDLRCFIFFPKHSQEPGNILKFHDFYQILVAAETLIIAQDKLPKHRKRSFSYDRGTKRRRRWIWVFLQLR